MFGVQRSVIISGHLPVKNVCKYVACVEFYDCNIDYKGEH